LSARVTPGKIYTQSVPVFTESLAIGMRYVKPVGVFTSGECKASFFAGR
jgi:hypothetical protein